MNRINGFPIWVKAIAWVIGTVLALGGLFFTFSGRVNEKIDKVESNCVKKDYMEQFEKNVNNRFEAVHERFDMADKRIDGVDKRIDDLQTEQREGFKEMREGFRDLNEALRKMNGGD